MIFTLLGTAAAPGIPVHGCQCRACILAKSHPCEARQKTAAMLEHNGKRILFDANANDFLTRFPHGSFDAIYLTHFHMDHVSALFDLRWGVGEKVLVYQPDDDNGADDLFKHPGILHFKKHIAFKPLFWQDICITPVPLNHSRPTFGYVIDYQDKRLAYLTDSAWLPKITLDYLANSPITQLYLDTSHSPQLTPPRNHHDIAQAKRVFDLLNPKKMGLIHITHDVVNWALDYPSYFDERFYLAKDNETYH